MTGRVVKTTHKQINYMTWNEQDLQRTEYEDNKSHKNLFQLYISQNQEDSSSRKKIWKPCQSDTRYGFVYLYWNMSLQLPYHRYISENLISHVSSFFAFQISQDKNLLYLGSPRANATFNNTVESRTSATIFYSVSESNCFRIARAVTTKIWYINMLVRYIYSH